MLHSLSLVNLLDTPPHPKKSYLGWCRHDLHQLANPERIATLSSYLYQRVVGILIVSQRMNLFPQRLDLFAKTSHLNTHLLFQSVL